MSSSPGAPWLQTVRRCKLLTPSKEYKSVIRNKHSTVVHDGQMIVFGGHDLCEGSFLASMLVYNMDRGAWDEPICTGNGPCARRAHSAVILKGHMIVFGGFSGDDCHNDVYALNLSSWSWTRLNIRGTAPCPRGGHSAVVDPSSASMFIYGGWDPTITYHSDVWQLKCDFDHGVFAWCEVHPTTEFVPPGRVGHCAVVYNNKMVIFGGYIGYRYVNDLIMFNLETHCWTLQYVRRLQHVPTARTYPALVISGNQLLVIGGSSGTGEENDVWMYNFTDSRWKRIPCFEMIEGRFAHTAIVYGTCVLVFGGISENARHVMCANYTGSDLLEYQVEDFMYESSLFRIMTRYSAANLKFRKIKGLPYNVKHLLHETSVRGTAVRFDHKGEGSYS